MKMTILVAVIRTVQPITVKPVVTAVAAATSHPATMTPQIRVQAAAKAAVAAASPPATMTPQIRVQAVAAAAAASPPALIIQQPTRDLVITEVILKCPRFKDHG